MNSHGRPKGEMTTARKREASSIAGRTPALRDRNPGETEVVEVVERSTRALPFLSFSYSITEVSSVGGRTRVRSRTQRLADGKLVSEKFEGELEAGAYDRLAAQASEQFASQLSLLMQPFSWLLPFRRDRGK